jgi:ABC-2 type transport system ATP-binding protein
MLVGLLRADAGTLRVAGHDVAHDGTEARRAVGYLPEDLELYERLTGREFLRFVSGLKGLAPDDDHIEEQLGWFGILDKADHLIKEYSLGMKKKTGLLAAFLGSPRVLVLDEPLNALDAYSMRLVERRLAAFRDAGGAVLLSSHVMAFVERVCSRVLVLRGGKVSASGPPAELRAASGLGEVPFDDVFFHYAASRESSARTRG